MRAAIVIAALALGAAPAAADRIRPPDTHGPARISRAELVDDGAILTIDRGSDAGVEVGWRGHLVIGDAEVPRGSFTITSVTHTTSTAKVAVKDSTTLDARDLRAVLGWAPVEARIVDIQIQGGDSVFTISAGTEQGIAQGWIGRVVDRDGVPLAHGDFTITRVTRRASVSRIRLAPGVLDRHPDVIVEPPPAP